jgi:hypothetical protein
MRLCTHLELWQSPDEGPELLLWLRRAKHAAHQPTTAAAAARERRRRGRRGQARLAVLHVLLGQVLVDGRVELGLQEGEEEVEEVDEEGVANW